MTSRTEIAAVRFAFPWNLMRRPPHGLERAPHHLRHPVEAR
jgi:hypothetical protein